MRTGKNSKLRASFIEEIYKYAVSTKKSIWLLDTFYLIGLK